MRKLLRFASMGSWILFLGLVVPVRDIAAQTHPASDQEVQPEWGTSEAPTANETAYETDLASISSQLTFTAAGFGSGGVGLRNQGSGALTISGVTAPVRAAYLYWAVITEGAARAPDKNLMIERIFPTPASGAATIAGTLIGTGGSPCWRGNTISVFRGEVPTSLANGNGVYQVTLFPGAAGNTAGGSPWVGTPALPLFEGASLVVVGTGPATSRITIFDAGLAGKTFHGNPGLSYTLTLPVAAAGNLTQFDSIGADGQEGKGRTARAGLGDEETVINGVHIAGPLSLFNDSDWNGSSSKPLTQLWDDIGHDITTATPAGTATLNIRIANQGESYYDCATPVANVVSQQ